MEEKRQSDNLYFMDPENAAEMARLLLQDRLFTKAMGGLFPEPISPQSSVIDIGCGPGAWLLDLVNEWVKQDPECSGTVLGVDIDQQMIRYAQAQAQAFDADNAHFEILDIRPLPWPYPDASFDIVNARLIAFFPPNEWPDLVKEMARITRPGGVVRLTETEMSVSNSPALETWHEWFFQALHRAGQSFSANGHRVTITAQLSPSLRRAGLSGIKTRAYGIDWSSQAEAHDIMYNNFMLGCKLFEPFLIATGTAGQEELDQNYAQILVEMQREDFAAIHYLLSAWGVK